MDDLPRLHPNQIPRLPTGRAPEPIKPIIEGAMNQDRLRDLVAARAAPMTRKPPHKNSSIDVVRDGAIDPARLRQMMEDRAAQSKPMPQPTRPSTLPAAQKDKALNTEQLEQRINDWRTTKPTEAAGDLFEGRDEADGIDDMFNQSVDQTSEKEGYRAHIY
jgi:hypothetical protein